VLGLLIVGAALAGCGSGAKSGSSSGSTSSTSSPTTAPGATTPPPGSTTTTGAVAAGAPTCPTMAQADSALGVSDSGPVTTSTKGGGIVCEYTGGAGNAAVAIFAHQTATVFAGQVGNAPGAPAMPQISGVGDGAFGSTIAGRFHRERIFQWKPHCRGGPKPQVPWLRSKHWPGWPSPTTDESFAESRFETISGPPCLDQPVHIDHQQIGSQHDLALEMG